ncbi:hypothetical protein ACIRUL_07980 [Streptomyces sp. NPDC101171]|uniref:hypothetical protein n=1 Tax=Streptomyces sp. NPDC101171 TaxID=3366122 RepID=UPI0037F3AFC5
MARVGKRTWIACGVIGAVCCALAVSTALAVARQRQDARRIDAAPRRVTGVVEHAVPEPKGGVRMEIAYTVGVRRYATHRELFDLPYGTKPRAGVRVCLEVAASRPTTNRLCGQRYPAGDDWVPAYGLMAVAGTIGVLACAGTVLAARRARPAPAAGDGVLTDP